METRQLEYFVAVAEELSFTRAAQRLYAVQSTVSAAVRALETELGARLFDRSTRKVALSAAGVVFLPEAKAAIEAVERARATVQEASAGLRGSLRIGTLTAIGSVDLPALLGAFHRRYPLVDIQVTVSITGSTGLAEDVRQGRLDAALVGLPGVDLPGLDVRALESRPFVALLPHGHPLAREREIRLESLARESFVDMPRGFGNRVLVDRAYEALGSPRRVTVEVADLRTVPGYVRAGLGIAVIPEVPESGEVDVVALPLAGAGLDWPLNLVSASAKPPSQALRTLLDLVTAQDHI
ncbi:LysR family transcriptional regulator [Amycolatopsis sp. NBC_01307]|uniref:LysR family transcriptional regulator n=1 Tax=Amycolatopsis sp. NBC_01307 TaxID=2903561 RepID=UPI002E12AF2D|nr:LysR family transcriptional regulator [Amycolatopsis sp. NBC_01307]